MNRSQMLRTIASRKEYFDFIIIGGGATGIGILLEAVTRGYSAALFEASDFTSSTSSKSTKLIHGGVRYLAQGNIGLVREASIERGILKQNAPHIIKDQSFIIPVFSVFSAFLYTIGLKFYDFLAGKYSLGRSLWIDRKKVLSFLPGLKTEGLKGGILYHDGQFEDSRLAFSVLRTACNNGGVALNYMPVKNLIKDQAGKTKGVFAIDELSGREFSVHAKYVINATGVFADSILEMDKPGHKKTIRPSQGIHLVLDKKFLPGSHALMIPKTEDGRVLFAVPWLNRLVVGTTDTPVDTISLEPKPLEEEIEFILSTASKYLVHPPSRKDVLSVFAGLRPLAGHDSSEKTKEISRSHKISMSNSDLVTIIGGKWTTYRKMAEDLVNKVENYHSLPKTTSSTRKLKLFGYQENAKNTEFLSLFGTEAEEITKISREKGNSGFISQGSSITVAQVIYSMRHEMAVHVEDILARRTRALLLDAREAHKLARNVAEIMAREGGFGNDWIEREVKDFQIFCERYIL